MATQAAVHQRNMESAILFMQQEHANTLKGLHEEIRNLQKKCSDLTFQINMQGLDLGETDSVRVNDLQKEIDKKNETETELTQKIEMCNQHLKNMELHNKKQKMKHMEEMRAKTQDNDRLKAEVESKANQIAYLTSELHKLKRLQLDNSAQAASRPLVDAHFVPMPPPPRDSQKIRRGGLVRHSRPTVSQEVLAIERRDRRGSSGRSSSTSRSDSPNELARPFLRQEDSDPQVALSSKSRDPLPPIIKAGPHLREEQIRKQVFKVVHPPHSNAKHTSSKTREIKLLAVEPPAEAKWGHPQGSHSSEYN